MSVRTDVINLNVNVNGNAAQNQLNELKKRASDIKIELQGMKKGTADYISKSAELEKVNAEMDKLKKEIGITSLSLKELNAERKKLTSIVSSVDPTTAEFHKWNAELQAVILRQQEVKANMAGFSSVAQQELNKVESTFGKVFTRVAEYTAAYFAIDKIKEFFSSAIEEANHAEEVASKLNAALTNIGRQDAFERLKAAAKDFADEVKTFDDDDIIEVFQKLITYGKLTESQIKELTPVIMDLAAHQHIDLATSTDLVVKSLEGNNKGLKEYGINIKEASTVTGRFGIIMDELKPKIAGAAKEFGETTAGEIQKTKVQIENLEEEIGGKLQPVVKGFYQFISDALSGLKSIFENTQTFLINTKNEIIYVSKVLGDFITFQFKAGKALQEQHEREKQNAAEKVRRIKEISTEEQSAYSIAKNASSKTIEDQEKLLRSYQAIQKTSIDTYNQFKVTNTQYTAEGRKAAVQLEADTKIVQALRNSITAQKDTRVLGSGKPDEDSKEIKSSENKYEQLKKQADEFVSKVKQMHDDLLIEGKLADDKEVTNVSRKYSTLFEEVKTSYTKFQEDLKNIDSAATSEKSTLKTEFEIETKNFNKESAQYVNAYSKFQQDLKNIDISTSSQKSIFTTRFETEIKNYGSLSEQYKNVYAKFQEDLKNIDTTATSKKSALTTEFEIETKNFNKQSIQYVNAYSKFQQDLKNIDNSNAEQKSTRTSKFNFDTKDFYKQSEEYKNAYAKLQQSLRIIDDKELISIHTKYTNLISDAKQAYAEVAGNHLLNAKQEFALEKKYSDSIVDLKQQEATEIERLYKKRFIIESTKLFEDEYKQSLDNQKKFDDELKQQAAKDYADGKITKEQYTLEITRIDKHEKEMMLRISEDYSSSVKQAAQDVTTFSKQQLEQQTIDLVNETDKKNKLFEDNALAEAKQKVITTRPGSKENVQAQKDVITTHFLIDTAGWNTESQKFKEAYSQYQQDLNDIDQKGYDQRAENRQKWEEATLNALYSVNQIINGIENRQLEKEKTINTAKASAYKKQLDSKLISQAEYDKKTQELSDEQEKDQLKIQKRQAERQKILSAMNIAVSTYEAVAKTWVLSPETFGLPWSAVIAGLGALEIAAVLAQPSLGKGAWVREGDKHSAPSGGINAKIERDEAVISAAAMTDKRVHTVQGTVAQITSKLNSINGGAAWAAGAGLQPKWRSEPVAYINPDMPRILAAGLFNSTRNSSANSDGQSFDINKTNELLQELISKQEENTQEIKNMKTNLKAHVVFKEIKQKENEYDTAKQASSLKQ